MSQYRVMKVNVRGPKTVGLKTRENELSAGTVVETAVEILFEVTVCVYCDSF